MVTPAATACGTLDRLIHLATPRVKDFRGLNPKAFDRQGNYSMGLSEQGVFLEINMAEVNFTHGMNINLKFDRSSPEKSRHLLTELAFRCSATSAQLRAFPA